MVDIARIDKITSKTKAKKDPAYADFYVNFNKHPESNILARATNEEAVKRALKNLLLTNKRERRFNASYGGSLDQFLFEDISEVTSNLIKSHIMDTIAAYEPRVNVLDVAVVPNEYTNSYEIGIYFEIINSVTPVALTLTLRRVR